MKWEIGDVAICIAPGSEMENKEVTIISDAFFEPDKIDLVHQVDPGMSPGDYSGWGAERRHLRPLPHPNELSTWDDCAFKPKEMVSSRESEPRISKESHPFLTAENAYRGVRRDLASSTDPSLWTSDFFCLREAHLGL